MSAIKALCDDLEARGTDPLTHGPTVGAQAKVTLDRRREEARAQEEAVRYSAAAVLVEREAMMRLAFESPALYERIRKAVERVELEARGGVDL